MRLMLHWMMPMFSVSTTPLVREMAKRSQIIVVTHNKHTMEVAGKLYGVTMQERGVSTMVSVSLQDIH